MTFRVDRIELFDLVLPLVEPFLISGGAMHERRSVIAVMHDGEGGIGYGESPPFELPFYSEETLAGARDLLSRVLVPRLAGQRFESPEALDAALRVGVRGNPFARAALETAAWDLEADRRGLGLADLLAERLGREHSDAIPCGVALGIPADGRLETLATWVADAVERGYRRVKIKVRRGWDTEPVAIAREALGTSGLPLTVDANGGYDWPSDEAALRALDETGLLYIEQPLAPDDLLGHIELTRRCRTPICLDESLRDARAARQVETLDGPRVWNVKVHRVGGLTEALRIWKVAARFGATLWAGTMPESGIGSQAALAAASMPLFDFPSDLEPSARWFGRGRDVVELSMSRDGTMAVPRSSIRHLLDRDRFAVAARPVIIAA